MKQSELAELMTMLGQGWAQATVSAVERGERKVHVDELGALAAALGTTIPGLLASPSA